MINTPSRRLVLTAGHCLKHEGRWSNYIAFVPSYHRGRRPYGTWTEKTAWVTGPWANYSDVAMSAYDMGVVVTRRSAAGRRIGDVTGALTYRSFPRRYGRTYIYGYPAGSNRAREVRMCADRRTWGAWPGINAWCNMAGGSSGGPWMSAYDDGNGGTDWIVDGLTSMGWPSGRMGSPWFGSHFRRLIYNAENR